MNKKANTALFIVGATVANIILMVVFIVIGTEIVRILLPSKPNPQLAMILLLLVFVVSIAGSFLVYHRVVKFISNRVDMEKYFHPIFRSRRR